MKSFITMPVVFALGASAACSSRPASETQGTPTPDTARVVRPAAGKEARVAIPVEGMTCAACSVALRTALRKIDGVKSVEVSVANKDAVIVYDDTRARPEQFVAAIDGLGYHAGTPARQ